MSHKFDKELSIYSEKLGKTVTISENLNVDERYVIEDAGSSMVGWTHNGWNNDNGGAGW